MTTAGPVIGYYVHHHGSGHARRATAVARCLEVPVVGLGSGGRPEGWPGGWVDLPHDAEPPVSDPSTVDATAHGRLHWVPEHHLGLARRHAALASWAAEARPALAVVDVSVEVTLQLRLSGIPVVVGGMPGVRTDPVHALGYDVAEAILAPWPATAHLGGSPEWGAKTWHVGAVSALAEEVEALGGARRLREEALAAGAGEETFAGPAGEDRPGGAAYRVLLLWGSGGDGPTGPQLEAAVAATPGWEWVVRGGTAGPSPDLVADLAVADVVVCHAGQGSVADVALMRRPAVVVAQPRPFDEQLATAREVDRLGLGVGLLSWPEAQEWPALLDRARELGGDGWERWEGGGGPEAARRLTELARTLQGRSTTAAPTSPSTRGGTL